MGERIRAEERYVYFVQAKTLGLVKIGVANNAAARLASLQTASPDQLVFLGAIRCRNAEGLEFDLHSKFRKQRIRGEWFRPTAALMRYIRNEAASIDENMDMMCDEIVDMFRRKAAESMVREAEAVRDEPELAAPVENPKHSLRYARHLAERGTKGRLRAA